MFGKISIYNLLVMESVISGKLCWLFTRVAEILRWNRVRIVRPTSLKHLFSFTHRFSVGFRPGLCDFVVLRPLCSSFPVFGVIVRLYPNSNFEAYVVRCYGSFPTRSLLVMPSCFDRLHQFPQQQIKPTTSHSGRCSQNSVFLLFSSKCHRYLR